MIVRGDAAKIPLADNSVDFTMFSPPYLDCRTYGINAQRNCSEWIEWMLGVVRECVRVCNGAVVVVAAGVTRDRNYWPACEGLMYEWWKSGGGMYRPCYWHRVGIPGSGGDQWFRADVEYAMCFKRAGKLPWTDNTAMGHAPKWAPEGIRHAKRQHSKSRADGTDEIQNYAPPVLANPGNLVKVIVGGGVMGDKRAHENEAPYPEKLCEWFILSLCPPGGIVLDPFGGSGTTAAVALRHHRRALSMDIRQSQCELTRRRLSEIQLELIA